MADAGWLWPIDQPMFRSSPQALICILLAAFLCAAGVPLVAAQENFVSKIGVAMLQAGPGTVSGSEARDRLVKSLKERKPDKKSHLRLDAVALDATSQQEAMAEAREKTCEFVLFTRLSNLETNYRYSTSNGGQDMPVFNATVEYQLDRLSDGSGFPSGSIKAEDPSASQEAVWQTLSQIASKVASQVASGKGTPDAPAIAAAPVTAVGTATTQEMPLAPDSCAWLPSGIAHADALRAACEYAITLPEKMPNFVCGQETARYRGNSGAPVDLISASVRYEDGKESYSDVKINGRPPSGLDQTSGLRSTGEFGGDLQNIFDLTNNALFVYAREGQAGERTAWIFDYRVAEQKIPLWRIRDQNQVVAPPYTGELWLDQRDSSVLRFHSAAWAMPPAFSMKSVDLQIDYKRIAFGDGTNFVLPVGSTLTTVFSGAETSRNTVQFRDCHKFRARGRLVLKSESGPAGAGTAALPPDTASLNKELEDNEAIYASIREQTLRESETRRELEQKQMLDAVNASTIQRYAELRKEQQEIAAQQQAVARSVAAAAAADSAAKTVLRVSARLVLVSVVLRDASGHAVGNLRQQNFRLFDEGKPQMITHFSMETSASGASPLANKQEEAGAPAGTGSSVQAVTSPSVPPAAERDTAYLFDDVHASFADLASARDAATRYLGSLKEGERAAVFTTSGTVAVDFTGDREKLLAGLQGLRPHAIIPESSCPPISYYMADLMVNQGDLEANGVAVEEALECAFHGMGTGAERAQAQRLASAKAFEVLNAGNLESKNALAILKSVIRRTESMPGRRSIVLISPGFLAVTADMRQDVMEIVDRALHAGIVVNTMDARGLFTVGLSGNSGHLGTDRLQFDTAESQARNDVMFEFASGTGGVFFHSNNDLEEGFRRTAAAPEFVYVLGFSPQKLDGKFHKLKVTLNDAGNFDVQARRGYYALKPAVAK
jgi:VWFA-related protein